MLQTVRLKGKNSLNSTDIEKFIIDADWAVCFTHNVILGYSPETAVFA